MISKQLSSAKTIDGYLICEATEGHPISSVSPGFCTLTGYRSDEIIGRSCNLLHGPDTNPETVQAIRNALRAGQSFHGDILNYHKDGSAFMNQLQIHPVFRSGKIVSYIGLTRVVTEHYVKNVRDMFDSDDFQAAERAAKMGFWQWHIKANTVNWSSMEYEIFEQDPNVFVPSYESYLDCLAPDCRQVAKKEITALFERGINFDRFSTLKGNRNKVLRETGHLTYAADGTPEVMYGSVQDVTQFKRKEQELETHLQHLQQVQSLTGVGIMELDEEGHCCFVNKNMCDMTGLRDQSLMQKRVDEVDSPW